MLILTWDGSCNPYSGSSPQNSHEFYSCCFFCSRHLSKLQNHGPAETVCRTYPGFTIFRGGGSGNRGSIMRRRFRTAADGGLAFESLCRRRWRFAVNKLFIIIIIVVAAAVAASADCNAPNPTGWYLVHVPIAIVLQRVQDVLAIRLNEVGPRLPQRVYHVVYEADLRPAETKPTAQRTALNRSQY